MRLFILLTLLLCSCAPPLKPNNIDVAFQPLYGQFMSDASANGLKLDANQGLTIRFAVLEQPTALGEIIGECYGVGYGGGTIEIDKSYWDNVDSLTQEILLYHELGHCVLSEGHTNNTMAIMNALINNPVSFDTVDMPVMIHDLFKNIGNLSGV